MRPMWLVFRREFAAYFATPVAAVYLIVFLALAAGMTFLVSGFFERGQADLSGFFFWHPWLYLVLMPAIAMRLWAEERRSGTIEILMTLPVAPWQIVVGKWLAAWAFALLALVLTTPLWITVNVLGSPDNGVILSSYVGSMAHGRRVPRACGSDLGAHQEPGARLHRRDRGELSVRDGGVRPRHLVGAIVGAAFVIDAVRSMSFFGQFQHITDGVLELPSDHLLRLVDRVLPVAQRPLIEVKKAA